MCDYKTKYKTYLESHKMRRHGVDGEGQMVEKKLQCPHCPFSCFFKHEFNFHVKKHYPDKQIKCKLCDYQATCPSVLKYHMRSHTDNKPHECEICHHKFARPIHLANHLRVHTGEKPFACETCGQKFGEKRYLERHQYVHLGIKPFMCHLCSYSCVKKDTLKNHIRNSHGENALTEDMKIQRKKVLRLYELPTEEQVKLVGYTVKAPAKTKKIKDVKPAVVTNSIPVITNSSFLEMTQTIYTDTTPVLKRPDYGTSDNIQTVLLNTPGVDHLLGSQHVVNEQGKQPLFNAEFQAQLSDAVQTQVLQDDALTYYQN